MGKQTYLRHFSKISLRYEQMAPKSAAREKYKFVYWKKAREMGLHFHIFLMQSPTLLIHIEVVCCLCYTNIEALEAAVTELWSYVRGVYKAVMHCSKNNWIFKSDGWLIG